MTSRERLHQLVDELDEPAADALLADLNGASLRALLDAAPPDDEPFDERDLIESDADIAAGRVHSLEEVFGDVMDDPTPSR